MFYFNIVQGIVFLEYVDFSVMDVVISGFNNMMFGEKVFKVQKVSIGIIQVVGEFSVNVMFMFVGIIFLDNDVGRVFQFLNMVIVDEFMDNDDYEGLLFFLFCIIILWVVNVMNQKFVMMYKRSVRSLVRFFFLRFFGWLVVVDSQLVWVRFLLSLRIMKLLIRFFGFWLGGSLLIGLW